MRKIFATAISIFLAAYLQPVHAQVFGGNPARIKWKQVQNSQLRVIFPAGLDSHAHRVLQVNSLLDSSTLNSIGARLRKWDVVLQNQTTESNAYVRMAPVMSEFYLTPDPDNFSSGSIRWDDNLAIHENRHMQQLSNFNHGLTRLFAFFLGQEGQLLANGITVPDYFFEGDAVWQETLVSRQGRGRMPSFYNSIKALWLQDKKYNWMKLRSGSYVDLTPNHYELGYMLIAYGYEKFGNDFWQKVTTDAVNFKGLFYPFNRAIERYAGVSYKQFRQDALDYFKAKTLTSAAAPAPGNFITPAEKNNVVSYRFPAVVSNDTLLVSKAAYDEVSSFYLLVNGDEKKLRVRDFATDDYFSYRNGKIVYAAYRRDPLRGNRNYSELRLLDIYTNKQRSLTHNTKYFSPDISEDGALIVAVNVNPDGSNALHLLDAATGNLLRAIPNNNNYFFTQTKFIDKETVVSAVRHPDGRMALVTVALAGGATKALTAFSYDVLGYPSVQDSMVYFTRMHNSGSNIADMTFAVNLVNGQEFQITDNANGEYQPVLQNGKLIVSAYTADGYRLKARDMAAMATARSPYLKSSVDGVPFAENALSNLLSHPSLQDTSADVSSYKKGKGLFNFHSARPSLSAEEYAYRFYSDNVLSTYTSVLSVVYNRVERSTGLGYQLVYSGAFPFITAGFGYTYNRNIDTSLTQGINFNAAKANLGFYVPLRFISGRNFQNLTIGGGYNWEQVPYAEIGKDVFKNTSFKYLNSYINFSNRTRQALQNINPRYAQSVSLSYRQAFNYFETGKLVGNSAFYFPGIGRNHSLGFGAAYQVRDSLPDLFSNSYVGARGYESLNTRRMYRLSANYHFPLFYPDFGVGNIFFLQRIRANVFYDYNNARARYRGNLTNIIYRSTGAEIYLDGKLWNALDAGIGVRYSYLLDTDLQYPRAKNKWEIILPLNLIPD